MSRRPFFLAAVLSACLAATGCEPPPGGDIAQSEAVAKAGPPMLTETAQFNSALASAGPDAERLQAGADDLAARAAALNARAAGLAQGGMSEDERARLQAARTP